MYIRCKISLEKLSDEQLLNGGFEKGSGNNDIYSWHLRSTTKVNGPTTSNWVKNYEFTRIDGYHGDAVSITRKGIGYVALDSNLMKVTEGANYVIDYAYRVANAEKSFIGVTAYVSEFGINQELLCTTAFLPLCRWTCSSECKRSSQRTRKRLPEPRQKKTIC